MGDTAVQIEDVTVEDAAISQFESEELSKSDRPDLSAAGCGQSSLQSLPLFLHATDTTLRSFPGLHFQYYLFCSSPAHYRPCQPSPLC